MIVQRFSGKLRIHIFFVFHAFVHCEGFFFLLLLSVLSRLGGNRHEQSQGPFDTRSGSWYANLFVLAAQEHNHPQGTLRRRKSCPGLGCWGQCERLKFQFDFRLMLQRANLVKSQQLAKVLRLLVHDIRRCSVELLYLASSVSVLCSSAKVSCLLLVWCDPLETACPELNSPFAQWLHVCWWPVVL